MNDSNFFAELSPLGLLKVTGQDAEKFLQGQLTCDVQMANQQQSCLGAHCDPKGRAQATFRLFHIQGDYYLQLPKDTLDILLNSLKKYAIFSKVTLENVTNEWQQLGVYGPDSAIILNKLIEQSLPTTNNAITFQSILIVRLSNTFPRFCLLGNNTRIKALTEKLTQHCQATVYPTWELLDITHGIPTILPATSGLFTPQQINYTAIDGVSFTKGCYIGQEIIARTHYLGKVKQQMYGITFMSKTPIHPGMTIYNDQHQECGTLIQAVATTDDHWQGLAVLLNETIQQKLYVEQAETPVLRLDRFTYAAN